MIIQTLDTINSYQSLRSTLETVKDFLENFNFDDATETRIELDGSRLFAVLQEYNTRDESQIEYESHDKYIDVQYLVSGQEKILICGRDKVNTISIPYDDEGDIRFYKDPTIETTSLVLSPGDCAIFLPEDCHKTQCSLVTGHPTPVQKIIVKIQI